MKIDLVKLVEEVYKLEGEPKNVNKVFALICLQAFKEQLTLTDVVKSDSEQLPSFLYKSDGGLYFKHLEDTDITDQWNEYLKTR